MYQIFSTTDGVTVCLHDNTVANTAVKLDSPVLTLEDSKAGTLTFKIPPNNVGYGAYTEYDTTAGAIENLSEVSDVIFEDGSIGDDGQDEAISNPNMTIRCAPIPVPDETSLITTNIRLTKRVDDRTNDWIDGDISSPTDSEIIHTDYIALSWAGIIGVDATLKPVITDIMDSIQQGSADGLDNTDGSTFVVATSKFANPLGVHDVSLTIEGVSAFSWRAIMFTNSGAVIGTSEWLTSSDSYSNPSQDFYWVRYEVKMADDSEILVQSISSIKMNENPPAQWGAIYYSYNKEALTSSRWLSQDQASTATPSAYYYRLILSRVGIRVTGRADVTHDDIISCSVHLAPPYKKRYHLYSGDGAYYGHTQWTDGPSGAVGFSSAAKVRCELMYRNPMPISYTEVDSTSMVMSKRGIVKTPRQIDLVSRMVSIITVKKLKRVYNETTGKYSVTKTDVWEGRVVSESRDFYNMRTITCEGELAYLNDTCQPPKLYRGVTIRQFIEGVLNAHNSKVTESKRFYPGTFWLTNDPATDRQTNYQKTLNVINDLLSSVGGHIKIRHADSKRYIDWYEINASTGSGQTVAKQTINFGENLLDFTCDWDMTKLCTVLVPTGAELDQGSSKNAGDPLELNNGHGPTYGQLLYLDSDGTVQIEADPSLGGYKTAVAVVEPGKNYYFSGRLHGGYVAYTIKSNPDGTGNYFSGGTKTAGSASQVGFEDFIDHKITIPEGAHSVVMCSFGDDIPLALKDEVEGLDKYVTIEDCATDGTWHSKGSLYLTNQEAITKYGWIENQLSRTDIKDKDQLYEIAKLYLQQGQFDEMTIEISAMDMAELGADVEDIDILDYVQAVSPPHGLDKLFPVTKLEIHIDKPAEQKLTLGSSAGLSLTNSSNEINEDIFKQLSQVPSFSKTIATAKANAAELINTATNGNISYINNSEGHPMEMVISDRLPYDDPNAKVWRWNMGGLGYSDHGYTFGQQGLLLALTADGAIVADRITTGTLRAIDIQGCFITAGGLDGQSGSILIKSGIAGTSADPNYAVYMDEGSMYFGYYNGSQFQIIGQLQASLAYDVQGQNTAGVQFAAPVIALDADHLWVRDYSSGDPYSVGVTTTLGVTDNNGKDLYMKFINGLLVQTWVDEGE